MQKRWEQFECRRTNASQARFGIATGEPDSYFVFLLTRLSDNATNVILEFKVFANHGPAKQLSAGWAHRKRAMHQTR
jgi:hypothetical protein